MLTAAVLAVAVTAAAGVAAPGTAGAASTPADEAVFLTKINALRASVGLAALSPDPALAATSCTWNDQLIVADALSHDPNLSAAIASVEPNWSKGGENVGMGGTVDSLFDAFVASPGHYKNLVDPDYSRVGICSARSATGKLFTTHRFLGVRSTPAPPPPPPPPPPTTAAPPPPPPTPAATAPPTTPAPAAPPTTPSPTAAPAPAAAAAPRLLYRTRTPPLPRRRPRPRRRRHGPRRRVRAGLRCRPRRPRPRHSGRRRRARRVPCPRVRPTCVPWSWRSSRGSPTSCTFACRRRTSD